MGMGDAPFVQSVGLLRPGLESAAPGCVGTAFSPAAMWVALAHLIRARCFISIQTAGRYLEALK
jgi:hypothetical protein